MATQIVVPALGESITEATVSKWLKSAGEAVAMDEPLVELETDKVTLEVPAAAGGVLGAIDVAEGQTVEVGRSGLDRVRAVRRRRGPRPTKPAGRNPGPAACRGTASAGRRGPASWWMPSMLDPRESRTGRRAA